MLLWLAIGTGCITLLVSGVHGKDVKLCKGVQIEISGVSNNYFIDKNDVYAIIKNFGGDSTGKKTLASIDLKKIEKELEKDVWVKNAELYFDNNDMLKVFVEEREPIARVFTAAGNTFYIDSSCMMLPLSNKFSARLPVFTDFVSDAKILSAADSSLLCDVKNLSLKISADSFLMAMIDQVDITPNRTFEMIPKIGTQSIVFGDALDADAKFSKLKLFYKNIITQAGWNRYKAINLQYKDEVVAVIRGKEDITEDSLKVQEIMKFNAEDAARRAADSSQHFLPDADKSNADSILEQPSMQHSEEPVADQNVNAVTHEIPVQQVPAKPVATTPVAPKPKPATIKPVTPKPVTHPPPNKKPVKPPKTGNDY